MIVFSVSDEIKWKCCGSENGIQEFVHLYRHSGLGLYWILVFLSLRSLAGFKQFERAKKAAKTREAWERDNWETSSRLRRFVRSRSNSLKNCLNRQATQAKSP